MIITLRGALGEVNTFLVSVVVILFLYYLIERTKFGLAVKAAASDMQVASLLGINVDKYIITIIGNRDRRWQHN